MRYRTHKFGAKRTEVDGILFHSKAEATRYAELKILERLGKVRDIQLQPKFPLYVGSVKIAVYIADFAYTTEAGERVVEDVKGMKTQVYAIKKKLFEALYPMRINEVQV